MKKITISAITVASLICLITSCGGGSGSSSQTSQDSTALAISELPRVKLQNVSTRDVDQTFDFTATVESNIKNNISPSMSVRIEKIYVEVGDRVAAGQKLVQMDLSGVKQAKAQLDNYEVEFKRVDELYKVGGISKSEWDAKQTALEIARTSFKNLEENTRLISPVSGIITARNYDSGDMFMTGKDPLLTVEQITPVKLLINVSETLFAKIKNGMDVKIQLDVYGDEVFHGKVSLVYPTIDPQTRTFAVELKIPNTDQRVRPGMFARVTMSFGIQNNVVVPDRAIIKQPGSGDRFVYVYKDGKVSYNKINLGRRLGAEYEVLSGVANGDMVVISGQSRLNNGAEVEVEQ